MKRLLRALDKRTTIDPFTATLLTIATPFVAFAAGIATHQRDFAPAITHFLLSLLYLALATLHWALLAYRQGKSDAREQEPATINA